MLAMMSRGRRRRVPAIAMIAIAAAATVASRNSPMRVVTADAGDPPAN
jgi:hypothetical protein